MKYFFLVLLITTSCIDSAEPKNLPSNEELQMQQNPTKETAAEGIAKNQYGIILEKNGRSINLTLPFLELLAGGILLGYEIHNSPIQISKAQWNYGCTSSSLFRSRLRIAASYSLIFHGSIKLYKAIKSLNSI